MTVTNRTIVFSAKDPYVQYPIDIHGLQSIFANHLCQPLFIIVIVSSCHACHHPSLRPEKGTLLGNSWGRARGMFFCGYVGCGKGGI